MILDFIIIKFYFSSLRIVIQDVTLRPTVRQRCPHSIPRQDCAEVGSAQLKV